MLHIVICPVRRCPHTDGYLVEVDYRDRYDEPGRVMRFRSWAAVFNCVLTPHYATVRVLWSQKADGEPMANP